MKFQRQARVADGLAGFGVAYFDGNAGGCAGLISILCAKGL
jgi:hypothetical protein